MINKNNRKNIQIVISSLIGITFITLYFFDPLERNIHIEIFDALLVFALVTIITFIPRWKMYSYFALIGYIIFLISKYLILFN